MLLWCGVVWKLRACVCGECGGEKEEKKKTCYNLNLIV